MKHQAVFKTAFLVDKFQQSGHPKYIEHFFKPRHSLYKTHRSQSDDVLLEVSHFTLIYKFEKHFDLSFAYDTARIWNDLPDDVHPAKSLFIQDDTDIPTLVFWFCLGLSLLC